MDLPVLHRLLVGFTASLIAVSAFSDLLAILTRRPSLRATAAWTLGYAAVITPFTAIAGYVWWDALIYPDQRRAMPHLWLGAALVVVLVPLAIWRGRIMRRDQRPGLLYLLAAAGLFVGSTVQSIVGRDAVLAAARALEEIGEHGCHGHVGPAEESEAPATAPVQARYVCPMHPDVSSERPGSCPQCGMKLVRDADSTQGARPEE